jgi:hypothetical protein
MIDYSDTPEHAAFRADVRTFIEASFPAGYAPDPRAENSLEPEDVLGYNWAADVDSPDPARRDGARAWAAALAERGWIAPHWPTEYGGAGLGPMEAFILHEEMMRARVPTVNGIGAFLIGPTILAHGTGAQKARFLPGIARGEARWAQGFSEPNAGSDLASLGARAVRDGDGYVVDGQKTWMSLGDHADWLFVLVRTDPDAPRKHHGITFLLIDAHSPGLVIRPIEDLRGDAPFAEVFFDGVRVPVDCRLGDENKGWYVAMSALTFERSGIGAVIKYELAMRDLIDYMRSDAGAARVRGDWHSAVRDELMQRYVEIRVLYAVALEATARHAAGAEPGYEASVNQLFGAELHQRLARTGAKVFGPLSRLWRGDSAPMDGAFTHLCLDSVAATFLAGTSEIQRNVIATRGLGLPRT